MTQHAPTVLAQWETTQILALLILLLSLASALIVGGTMCVIKLLYKAIRQREVNGGDVVWTAAVAVAAYLLSMMIGNFLLAHASSPPLTTGRDTAYTIATLALTIATLGLTAAQPMLALVVVAAAICDAAVMVMWVGGLGVHHIIWRQHLYRGDGTRTPRGHAQGSVDGGVR